MSEDKVNYFRQVQQELKKVSWTTREELIFCTKVVIVATLFFAIAIYVVDYAIKAILGLLGLIVHLIGG